MTEVEKALRPLSFRIGEVSAVRKDLEGAIEKPEDSDTIKCSVELSAADGPHSLEQEVFLAVENWCATYRLRLRASLEFSEGELRKENKSQWREEVLIPAACHAAFAEISRLGKQIDVEPILLPVEMIGELIESAARAEAADS